MSETITAYNFYYFYLTHKVCLYFSINIFKCNEFPDYCIGITRKGGPITGLVATDYMLREVSQLISGVTARKPDGCAPGADNPGSDRHKSNYIILNRH
jgi:hypothetical protein